MKYLLYISLAAFVFLSCNCEEPPYLSLPELPAKVIAPPEGENGLYGRADDSGRIIFNITFSMAMDTTSVILGDNTFISVYSVNSGFLVDLPGTITWTSVDNLVFTSIPDVYTSADYCLFECDVFLFLTNDSVIDIINLSGEVLDGDCDGESGGSFSSSFFIP